MPWFSKAHANFNYKEIPLILYTGGIISDIIVGVVAVVLLFMVRGYNLTKKSFTIYSLVSLSLLVSVQVMADFSVIKPYTDMWHIVNYVPSWFAQAGYLIGMMFLVVTLLIMLQYQ